MTCSYKFGCIFLLYTVRYIFFDINVISTLSGSTYKNIEKLSNKIFNVPNHLNFWRNRYKPCKGNPASVTNKSELNFNNYFFPTARISGELPIFQKLGSGTLALLSYGI